MKKKGKGKRLTRAQLVRKGMSIGAVAMRAILAGKDVDAVIAAVKKEHPKANTGRNSVLWYRSELRRQGLKVPALVRRATDKPRKKEAKKARRLTSAKHRAVPPDTLAAAAPTAERKAATA